MKNEREKTSSEQYGTTPEQIQREWGNFINQEGFFETSRDVIECQTFEAWLNLAFRKPKFEIKEPWQKGDLNFGL
jgi:hypothetical protein